MLCYGAPDLALYYCDSLNPRFQGIQKAFELSPEQNFIQGSILLVLGKHLCALQPLRLPGQRHTRRRAPTARRSAPQHPAHTCNQVRPGQHHSSVLPSIWTPSGVLASKVAFRRGLSGAGMLFVLPEPFLGLFVWLAGLSGEAL